MKNLYRSICLFVIVITGGIYADLSDVSPYWKAYNNKEYALAEDFAKEMLKTLHEQKKLCSPETKDIKDQDWLTLYLMRFYMSYMQNDIEKMKVTSNEIRFLSRTKFCPTETEKETPK
jgi:hypothetical protein